MSKFSQNGSLFKVALDQDATLLDKLPAAVYTVSFDPMQGYFLKYLTDSFDNPKKLYGTATNTSDRIISTFKDRTASTGVSLTGNQGSGKTLIAKDLSNKLIAEGVPVVIITSPYAGDSFIEFLNAIEQEIVILFEEFEKVYRIEEQEALLTLFDGVFQNKKLFVLTSNYSHKIADQLTNRPGRIYYNFHFSGLDLDTVNEYCVEKLNDHNRIDDVIITSNMYGDLFNFDMMKAIVEEMNRYPNEAMNHILEVLNIDDTDRQRYKMDSHKFTEPDCHLEIRDDSEFHSILSTPFRFSYYKETTDNNDLPDIDYFEVNLDPTQITKYDKDSHAVTFTDKNSNEYTFKPNVPFGRGSMFQFAF